MEKSSKENISFNRGVPETQSLPKKKVGEITEEVLNRYGDSLLQYGDSKGFEPLRNKLADWYVNATNDRILVGNGSLQILDMIANLIVEPGDTVLVESPTYDRAITIFNRAEAKVKGVKLEKDGPELGELSELITECQPKLFYTIPDFQNPTGVCATGKKRKKIVELTRESGTVIVEDSPYRKLRYRGESVPTLRSFSPERVVQVSSFSKLIGPGMRVGWVVGNPEFIDDLAEYAEDTYITPGLLSQGLVDGLIGDGWLKENIQDLISLYAPRLETTLESLEKYFPGADWVEPRGGFFVGLWLPGDTDVDQFYSRAEEENLVLSRSERFFPGRRGKDFLRLPFPALSSDRIEEGIMRLGEAWRNLKPKSNDSLS
ncbi:MAG: PLP-dependent aminotransferase family protein [Candidatus Bipolaricaulia bacterium]